MKETNILIRIDSDLKDKFKDYAESKGKSMTEILTEFIKSETKGRIDTHDVFEAFLDNREFELLGNSTVIESAEIQRNGKSVTFTAIMNNSKAKNIPSLREYIERVSE